MAFDWRSAAPLWCVRINGTESWHVHEAQALDYAERMADFYASIGWKRPEVSVFHESEYARMEESA